MTVPLLDCPQQDLPMSNYRFETDKTSREEREGPDLTEVEVKIVQYIHRTTNSSAEGRLACVAGASRGKGIGEIRRALEREGSAEEGGGVRACFSRFARILLPFSLLASVPQAKSSAGGSRIRARLLPNCF